MSDIQTAQLGNYLTWCSTEWGHSCNIFFSWELDCGWDVWDSWSPPRAFLLVLPYSVATRLKCEEAEAASLLKPAELKSFRTTLLSYPVSQRNSQDYHKFKEKKCTLHSLVWEVTCFTGIGGVLAAIFKMTTLKFNGIRSYNHQKFVPANYL